MKWSATALLCSILVACGAGDQATLPRAAVTTGNMEMIGNGLEDFLGRDSSGLAALDARAVSGKYRTDLSGISAIRKEDAP